MKRTAARSRATSADTPLTKVSIRPGVSVLSVLAHLNYQPWFAIAEFVDNAVQSFIDNKKRIGIRQLKIAIDIDTSGMGRISVRDNAAGIARRDYARAFRAAEVPPNRKGLSEFGMGMKSAACFFAKRWAVRTKAFGETVERKVSFDIARIVRDSIEELTIEERPASRSDHYTEIILTDLNKIPQKKSIAKIRDHLASIYRVQLRTGILKLTYRGDDVEYTDPAVLRAPHFAEPKGKAKLWKKQIHIALPRGRRIEGFAALRAKASVSGAGFALFRRGRVVQGSGDEGYRPEYIFGKSNSYAYQRLFGELHLYGFDVSHTKDGFRWEDDEELIWEKLRKAIDSAPISLLRQAQGYRTRPTKDQIATGAQTAIDNTADVLSRTPQSAIDQVIRSLEGAPHGPQRGLPKRHAIAKKEFIVNFQDVEWNIRLEYSSDSPGDDWLEVSERKQEKPSKAKGSKSKRSTDGRIVHVRMAAAHPFMVRFAGSDEEKLEAMARMGAAIALSEITARDSGVEDASAIRLALNELLLEPFSEA